MENCKRGYIRELALHDTSSTCWRMLLGAGRWVRRRASKAVGKSATRRRKHQPELPPFSTTAPPHLCRIIVWRMQIQYTAGITNVLFSKHSPMIYERYTSLWEDNAIWNGPFHKSILLVPSCMQDYYERLNPIMFSSSIDNTHTHTRAHTHTNREGGGTLFGAR